MVSNSWLPVASATMARIFSMCLSLNARYLGPCIRKQFAPTATVSTGLSLPTLNEGGRPSNRVLLRLRGDDSFERSDHFDALLRGNLGHASNSRDLFEDAHGGRLVASFHRR
jgi:hypothetical protein